MIEYNHKGEWCIYKDILCQEGACDRCNIIIGNRNNGTDICEELNAQC
jgi:hypothetical protein